MLRSMCRTCRPEEVRDVFDAGVVSEEQFCDDGAAIMRDANLLCRIGGSVYRWRHALPALAGRLAYPMLPWRRLLRRGMPSAGPADGSNSPSASPQVQGGTCVPASVCKEDNQKVDRLQCAILGLLIIPL